MIKHIMSRLSAVLIFQILLLFACGNAEPTDAPQPTTAGGKGTTIAPALASNCSAYTAILDCCHNGCLFANCTKEDTQFSSCQLPNFTMEGCTNMCEGLSTTTPTTIVTTTVSTSTASTTSTTTSTTTVAPDQCLVYKDKDTCCQNSCQFANCTKTDKIELSCRSMTFNETGCVNMCEGLTSTSPTSTTISPASTTATQNTTASPPAPSSNQHFDGPSFIGGIVLCACVVGIVFVTWKFYKARQERNYHHLH